MEGEYITKRLKTVEQIIEEHPNHIIGDSGTIFFREFNHHITPERFKYFGEEIEVELYSSNKQWFDGEGWLWNEEWFEPEFEPIEFISEEEMEI